ncbi:MAG: diadenylate cyclase CdaA [Gemmatales bacterium]
MIERFFQIYQALGVRDLVEISLLGAFIYLMLRFIGATRGIGMVRGLGIVVAITVFAVQVIIASFDLTELNKILDYILASAFIGIIVIFQPELRSGLFALGRYRLFRLFSPSETSQEPYLDQLAGMASQLSRTCTGALVVIQREASLQQYIQTGDELDSTVREGLLVALFQKNSPLHDGAVILAHGRLAAAACQLPLAEAPQGASDYGMRHRAALGISEETDAVVLVVSEETGRISLACAGKLETVTRDNVLRRLTTLLHGPVKLRVAA